MIPLIIMKSRYYIIFFFFIGIHFKYLNIRKPEAQTKLKVIFIHI